MLIRWDENAGLRQDAIRSQVIETRSSSRGYRLMGCERNKRREHWLYMARLISKEAGYAMEKRPRRQHERQDKPPCNPKERPMVNPFDPKAAFLAKHAQHVVLIHFPIALFIAAVTFDFMAQRTKRRGLAEAAYANLLVATISTVPVIVTGILAWQFQLEGQKLKGILLLHTVLASLSTGLTWLVWMVHFRAQRRAKDLPSYRLPLEFLAVAMVALTAHLGGFLSGVNGLG
jgi:uncharacterized membrane protein